MNIQSIAQKLNSLELLSKIILILQKNARKISQTLSVNMIKKNFFSGGFAPELFMVLSNVCAKFEPFLYFKIFCKIILKF